MLELQSKRASEIWDKWLLGERGEKQILDLLECLVLELLHQLTPYLTTMESLPSKL